MHLPLHPRGAAAAGHGVVVVGWGVSESPARSSPPVPPGRACVPYRSGVDSSKAVVWFYIHRLAEVERIQILIWASPSLLARSVRNGSEKKRRTAGDYKDRYLGEYISTGNRA